MRNLIAILLFFCGVSATYAQSLSEQKDSAFQKLYREYLMLYSSDKEQEFLEASKEMRAYSLKFGNRVAYYKIWLNEVLFDAEHNKSFRAIEKANRMLEDMKNNGEPHYDMVYAALGTIYESRGNYRMADHYYNDALKMIEPKDTGSLISIYSRLASLKTIREPQKAWEWNERFGALAINSPHYYKVYLALKGEICFFSNDKEQFLKTYNDFGAYITEHPNTDDFGVSTMQTLHAAFTGQYDKALKLLDNESLEFNEIDRLDLRIKIYELMGKYKEALAETDKRRELRDSLNSDMLFDNINSLYTEMGVAKLNEKTAREREIWLAAVIALLLAALGLLISRGVIRHRYQKRILKQNEELEIALDEAKESDRMKSSFIEHVSHEIRTPLNIITGYAQIITAPDYELDEEQRDQMLQSIAQNTTAITNIVNDLLEIAQDESKERYRRDDTVAVNALCRKVMGEMKQKNNGRLRLSFQTGLSDDFTMQSNQSGIEKILYHVLDNALKFTEQGSVELYVHETPDHGNVRFVVTDTGVGIPEDQQEKVFERFYKVDTFKQGFGLGLPMSRKIALLLGGALAVDKLYEDGARLVLILPIGGSKS